jgi:hypothetical protein
MICAVSEESDDMKKSFPYPHVPFASHKYWATPDILLQHQSEILQQDVQRL